MSKETTGFCFLRNVKLKEDSEEDINHPALAQLDEHKKKVLQDLENKIKKDFLVHMTEILLFLTLKDLSVNFVLVC